MASGARVAEWPIETLKIRDCRALEKSAAILFRLPCNQQTTQQALIQISICIMLKMTKLGPHFSGGLKHFPNHIMENKRAMSAWHLRRQNNSDGVKEVQELKSELILVSLFWAFK